MAITLLPAQINVGATRTVGYTCPAGKSAIVFDGTLSNKDATRKGHLVTVETQTSGGSYFILVKDVIVPYGISIRIPKYTLSAGDKLVFTADQTNMVDAVISIAEKS